MQYRMHPSISSFPNSRFYHNQIQDAPVVRSKSYEKRFLSGSMFGPYSFLNVLGGREEKDDDGHSRKNMVEVAVVIKILEKLYKGTNSSQDLTFNFNIVLRHIQNTFFRFLEMELVKFLFYSILFLFF